MRFAFLSAAMLVASAAPAFAQPAKLPPVALDARVVWPMSIGQDAKTATSLAFPQLLLPKHAIGYGFGLHLYPARGAVYSLGIGGEYIYFRTTAQQVDATGKAIGQEVTRRFQGLSGILSVNFGRGDGWSYLSAGMGPLVFDNFYSILKRDGPRQMTINFGGGARWFNTDHLAFSMDLRFYRTQAALATTNTAARSAKTMFIVSGGIAIK